MNTLRLGIAFVLMSGTVLIFIGHLRSRIEAVGRAKPALACFAVALFCGVLLGIGAHLVDTSLGYQTVHYGALLTLGLFVVGAAWSAWTVGYLGLGRGLTLYLSCSSGAWLGHWAGVQSLHEIEWWDDLYLMNSALWLVFSVLGAGVVIGRSLLRGATRPPARPATPDSASR